MNPPINLQQLILLFGGAVLLICLLVLVVYLLQRSLGHAWQSEDKKSKKVRAQDEAAFTLATVRAVIEQLKTDQKTTHEELMTAERRAEEYTRRFELLAREIEFGLLVFDARGFITFFNPPAQKLLGVDMWARRRYTEIFHGFPAILLDLIRAGIENGTEARKQAFEFRGADGNARPIQVCVLPSRDRSGIMNFVACTFQEVEPPAATV